MEVKDFSLKGSSEEREGELKRVGKETSLIVLMSFSCWVVSA
jgi:hypothetical protein